MNKTEKIAAIVAITQLFKENGLPSRWCPLVAIILGALFEYAENQTAQGIVNGVILGATVTGGYAVVKGTAQGAVKSAKKTPVETLEHDDYRGV